MISIGELDAQHADFVKRKFPNITDWRGPMKHCRKETKEAIESGEEEEFADVLLTLMSSWRLRFPEADVYRLLEAAKEKLIKCEPREWGEVNADGFQEHIKSH